MSLATSFNAFSPARLRPVVPTKTKGAPTRATLQTSTLFPKFSIVSRRPNSVTPRLAVCSAAASGSDGSGSEVDTGVASDSFLELRTEASLAMEAPDAPAMKGTVDPGTLAGGYETLEDMLRTRLPPEEFAEAMRVMQGSNMGAKVRSLDVPPE